MWLTSGWVFMDAVKLKSFLFKAERPAGIFWPRA
jgi:hypothetical protein